MRIVTMDWDDPLTWQELHERLRFIADHPSVVRLTYRMSANGNWHAKAYFDVDLPDLARWRLRQWWKDSDNRIFMEKNLLSDADENLWDMKDGKRAGRWLEWSPS